MALLRCRGNRNHSARRRDRSSCEWHRWTHSRCAWRGRQLTVAPCSCSSPHSPWRSPPPTRRCRRSPFRASTMPRPSSTAGSTRRRGPAPPCCAVSPSTSLMTTDPPRIRRWCWCGTRPARSTSASAPGRTRPACARPWPTATTSPATITSSWCSTPSATGGRHCCSASTRSASSRTAP